MNQKPSPSKTENDVSQAYDRLLSNPDFQDMRVEILRSIPNKQQKLLKEPDQLYLESGKVPKSIDRRINREYKKNIKSVERSAVGKRKHSLLSFFVSSEFIGGGFVAAGLALAVVGFIFASHDNGIEGYEISDTRRNIEIINEGEGDQSRSVIEAPNKDYQIASDDKSDIAKLPGHEGDGGSEDNEVELASDKKNSLNK